MSFLDNDPDDDEKRKKEQEEVGNTSPIGRTKCWKCNIHHVGNTCPECERKRKKDYGIFG